MNYALFNESYTKEVIQLFTDVFSESEGASEGKNIGNLVSNLISTTAHEDLIGCVAIDNDRIMGCIFFSRFTVSDEQVAFILSPVAIAKSVQGTGIGQRLINYGLNQLRLINANLVLTYGAPAFYCKTGFQRISEDVIRAPHPLSQPIGWLALRLDGQSIEVIHGSTACVEALNDPKYW